MPDYLNDSVREYLERFGCSQFIKLGTINGAPNVILIFDPTEVDDQGYEVLLRDEKSVAPSPAVTASDFSGYGVVLVFPGTYDLASVMQLLPEQAEIILDAAYDVESIKSLEQMPRKINSLIISTSSRLFENEFAGDFEAFAKKFSALSPQAIILKENRGGCRVYLTAPQSTVNVPAFLGETVNSVGVGDAFDAAYVSRLKSDRTEAVWRGAQVASCYAQTTDPDLFKEYVRRRTCTNYGGIDGPAGRIPAMGRAPKVPYLFGRAGFFRRRCGRD